MNKLLSLIFASTVALASQVATAQVLGLGTAQAGATVTIGQAIAKVVSEKTDLQMRTQGFPSTGQYGPRVNAGELDFGLSNVIETNFLYTGERMLPGRPQSDLRLAMVLFPLPVTFFSPERAGFSSPKELLNKRVPTGWTAQPLGGWLFEGFFANQGLAYKEISGLPIAAMPRMWDMFGQNQLDMGFSIFGGSLTDEMSSKVNGLRYWDLSEDPEAVARMRKILPYSYVSKDRNVRTGEVVRNLSYDFVVFTHAKMSDEAVYKVVKAMHSEAQMLAKLYPAEGREVRFAVESGIPFHPGAERFYREVGLWPPKK